MRGRFSEKEEAAPPLRVFSERGSVLPDFTELELSSVTREARNFFFVGREGAEAKLDSAPR